MRVSVPPGFLKTPTLTCMNSYPCVRVWVRVALGYPRVTRDNHYSQLHIVEPIASAHRPGALYSLHDKLVERVKKRQALWQSQEDLKRVFTNPNHGTAKWDPRVLD